MAENLEHAGDLVGPKLKRGEIPVGLGETTLSRDERLVFERWLRPHLSGLYQEVLAEVLPDEMNEIVERFKATRSPGNGDGKLAVRASGAASQAS
jgi:hypothetical protein